MKSFITFHLISFVLALFSLALIVKSGTLDQFIIEDKINTTVQYPSKFSGHYPNYNPDLQVEADVCYALKSPKSIVIFGSSELTEITESIPYYFIPANSPLSVLAIGHAGNQSLSILTQLAAMNAYLENSNVCIIISPGWFESKAAKGTTLPLFLEYSNDRFTRSIVGSGNLPDNVVNHIYSYVSRQIPGINSSTATLRLMHNEVQANHNFVSSAFYRPFSKINSWLAGLQLELSEKLVGEKYATIKFTLAPMRTGSTSKNYSATIDNINWENLFSTAEEESKKSVTTNNLGIHDEYYRQYANRRGHIQYVNLENNQEYKDFTVLLQLLKHFNSNASFVIQPLNPFYYDDIDKIDELMHLVEEDIRSNGFDCLNMLQADTTKYNKAMLRDIMHMDHYGWLQMNKFLIEKYNSDEAEN